MLCQGTRICMTPCHATPPCNRLSRPPVYCHESLVSQLASRQWRHSPPCAQPTESVEWTDSHSGGWGHKKGKSEHQDALNVAHFGKLLCMHGVAVNEYGDAVTSANFTLQTHPHDIMLLLLYMEIGKHSCTMIPAQLNFQATVSTAKFTVKNQNWTI